MNLKHLLTGAATVATATVAAQVVITQRWKRNPDPLDGVSPRFPAGDIVQVETDDGAHINTVTRGTGPPIVLVHGLTGSRRDWGAIAPRLLDQGFSVVGVEQRGHGDSTVGTEGFGVGRQAEDLAQVLETLDITDAVVAGHSMGGMAAMALAINHKSLMADRVLGLCLIATMPSMANRRSQLALKLGSRPVPEFLSKPGRHMRLMAGFGAFGTSPSLFMVDESLAMVGRCPEDTRLGATAGLLTHNVDDRLVEIEQPTLVIAGTLDRMTPIDHNRLLARAIPNARIEELEGAGHMLIWSRAAAVSRMITEFASSLETVGSDV